MLARRPTCPPVTGGKRRFSGFSQRGVFRGKLSGKRPQRPLRTEPYQEAVRNQRLGYVACPRRSYTSNSTKVH
jgi:hypothetical protein